MQLRSPLMVHRRYPCLLAALLAALACGCSRGPTSAGPVAIRLVDLFQPDSVVGATPPAGPEALRSEWRFDRPAAPGPEEFAATLGFEAGPGVEGLGIRGGHLVGRSTTDFPILRVARSSDADSRDQFHAVEIRLRVSAGENLAIAFRGPGPVDFALARRQATGLPWNITTPVVPGEEVRTYTLTSPAPINMARVRQILIRPTDVAGASFEIESVRLITRREYLASLPSGVAWQGLGEIYRESLVSRSPERLQFRVTLPERPWLDVAVGTVDDHPATFRVTVTPERSGERGERVVLDHTVTTPFRWEQRPVDLSDFGGQPIVLSLSLEGDMKGAPGLWGAPVVRGRAAATDDERPQGVILIHADTLRPDHLGLYGHRRDTAPFLAKLASEGVVFRNAFAQAGWTKVSTPSFLTSLYPSTHGVFTLDDRLPASATTLAEVYREAGYATLSLSSVPFTGQYTNLHQGFEELHEQGSLLDAAAQFTSKTAREYVDRATEWIDRHRDGSFFVYLHVFDPHSPYEPRRPYDSMWADPGRRDEHIRQLDAMRKVIANPFLAGRGMATRDEMIEAGIDPVAYLDYDKDWYDSSIRAMDAELARLFERLRMAGLDRRTAVIFLSDHGEEFHDHGRMWHGQSVYGEMMRVPLVVRWPAGVPAGRVVDEPVQLVDVMPTLLGLSRLPQPESVQGQSLVPLFQGSDDGNGNGGVRASTDGPGSIPAGWRRRPVILEKQPLGMPDHPSATEAYAIIDGGWKLIHNRVRPADKPEFELYDALRDPLDQTNMADEHPDIVQRLAKALDGWHAMASAARLKPDSEAMGNLTPDQLQRLRSLGYIK